MNVREAIADKLGLGPKKSGGKETESDAVTLDHARARRRIAERNTRAARRRVYGKRQRSETMSRHAQHIAAGQETVLLGGRERYGAMYDNVEKSVRTQIDDLVHTELVQEGKPREGTREFERETRRRVKVALAEVGLEPLKATATR